MISAHDANDLLRIKRLIRHEVVLFTLALALEFLQFAPRNRITPNTKALMATAKSVAKPDKQERRCKYHDEYKMFHSVMNPLSPRESSAV